MTNPLAGKPIAITGASSGIGLATAFACARAGMPVVLGARREDRLKDAVDRITREGGRAVAVRCDVTDPADNERLIDEGERAFGPLHAVFANAGYGIERTVLETSDEDLRAIFECNVYGTLRTIRPALARMLPRGSGHVLICSSAGSKIGIPVLSAYTATKAAQDHLGRALRIELLGTGIHVSTIHPIGTHTEFSQVLVEKGQGRARVSETPRHRKQDVGVVADAIVACLRRPRGEVWTHTPTRVLLGLATIFPGLGDRVLARVYGKRR